ncbi:MAG: alanine--glyoxylate aminotransferase family protein, partial [Candidatus Nealsonbacteria bacterium]
TRNFIKKKSLHVGGGEFAERWYEIAKSNNREADLIDVEWGKGARLEEIKEKLDTGEYDCLFVTHSETSTGVLHPIEKIGELVKNYPNVIYCVDAVSSFGGTEIKIEEWGIDVLVSSTQKCLAVPPGLAITIVSDKALSKAEEVEGRGYYFDFLPMKKHFDNKGETPSTPAISLFNALDSSLDNILKEGIENRYKRHLEMAEKLRSWAKTNFAVFSEEGYQSPTLTVIKNNKEIDVPEFIKKLKEEGFVIVNGYGKLKDKTFRIAHMGETTLKDIEELIIKMNEIISS